MSMLLLIHIITFSLSVIGVTVGLAGSSMGRTISRSILRTNGITTLFGVMTGSILLLQHPLGSQCALLVGYVAIFVLATTFIVQRNNQFALTEDS